MIIDRKTRNGQHLTAKLAPESHTLVIKADGDVVAEGKPKGLGEKLSSQLPDRFVKRVGKVPITAEERTSYRAVCKAMTKDLLEQYADADISITRAAGIGTIVRGDIPDVLSHHIKAEVKFDALDVPLTWDGFGDLQTTVADAMDAGARTEDDDESNSNDNSNLDMRHEGNCGARYSRTAACECGAHS